MENASGEESFKRKSVLAICAAGSDRSAYIAEELNRRGYFATNAGVLGGHNYVTKSDLFSVGVIVFSSIHEKKIFDRNKQLREFVKSNSIITKVLNITESDKNRAHNTGNVERIKTEISLQLDKIGLIDLHKEG